LLITIGSLTACLLGYFIGRFGEVAHTGLSGPTTTVDFPATILAMRDLPRGTIISPDMLQRCLLSREFIPERALTTPQEIVGRKTVVDIPAGSPILDIQLDDEATPAAMQGEIPERICPPQAQRR
jgi:Flp pilus assembly protein CpaB